jgi:hypothetical protein
MKLTMNDHPPHRRFPGILSAGLALLVVACSLIQTWGDSRRMAGIDFYHYWVVPHVLQDNEIGNIYSADGRNRIARHIVWESGEDDTQPRRHMAAAASLQMDGGTIETVATPFLFTVIGVFSTDNYEVDNCAYEFLSLAAFVLGVLLIARMCGHSWVCSLLFLVLFTWCFDPFESDLRVGNVNRLQLGFIALVLWFLSRPRHRILWGTAWYLMGIGLAFKPNIWPAPVVLGLFCLFSRDKTAVVTMVLAATGGLITAVLLASVFFRGISCWVNWLEIVPQVTASHRVLAEGNHGLPALLRHFIGIDLSIVLLGLGLVAAGLFARRCRRKPSETPKTSGPHHSTQTCGSRVFRAWPHAPVLVTRVGALLRSGCTGRTVRDAATS